MKTIILRFLLFSLLICLVAGCGSGGGGSKSPYDNVSIVNFNIDIKLLYQGESVPPDIADVEVKFTKDVYEESFYLNVEDDVIIDTLYLLGNFGTWHMEIFIYELNGGPGPVFTGVADVNIPPESIINITNSTLQWSRGYENPFTGYKLINQNIDKVFYDGSEKFYAYDSSQNKLGVYDLSTLALQASYNISPANPNDFALSYNKDKLILGYSTGLIYTCDLNTGVMTQIANINDKIVGVVGISPDKILIASFNNLLTTMNINTGEIVDTYNFDVYDYYNLELNETISTVYAHTDGISPADIDRIRLDLSTGDIVSASECSYHGDYTMGAPIRIINNGTKIATRSGNLFTCSTVNADDLKYSGKLPYAYTDLACKDGKIFMIGSENWYDDDKKLIVLDESTYSEEYSSSLPEGAEFIVVSPTHILITAEYNGRYYAKAYPLNTFTSLSRHGQFYWKKK